MHVSLADAKDRKGHRSVLLTPPAKKITAEISLDKQPEIQSGRMYYWYDNISIHVTQEGYSGYVLDGLYEEFYYPGLNLMTQGTIKNGIKTGSWTKWFANGLVEEQANWQDGLLCGDRYIFDSLGHLLTEEYYCDGELCINGKPDSYFRRIQNLVSKTKRRSKVISAKSTDDSLLKQASNHSEKKSSRTLEKLKRDHSSDTNIDEHRQTSKNSTDIHLVAQKKQKRKSRSNANDIKRQQALNDTAGAKPVTHEKQKKKPKNKATNT